MKIFIGVAWPYANSYLHLGHIAGAYLPASIFAEYQRLVGNEVLMVSGSDEHGTPILVTAEKGGKRPEDLARFYHEENLRVMNALDIGFDIFTETSTPNHGRVVKDFILRLREGGYIYENCMDEPYCTNEKRFLPDRYVEGTCPHCGYQGARGDQCDGCGKLLDPIDLIDMRCKICGSEPEMRSSKHLFFRLSSLQENLIEYLEGLGDELKPNVYNFTINFLKRGLKDRAITRDIPWGIGVPVKGYEEKRVYVWFEAVIGYLSASMEWAEIHGASWEDYWMSEGSKHYYFVGKDNIPFHTIIWPAMLMAHGGLKLPDNVPANEYLLLGKEKFSKSRGIGISVRDFLQRFDPDVVRYYLSSNMPEDRDSEFGMKDFIDRNNNELLAKLGNFVHRVLSFSHSNYGGIPSGVLEGRVRGEIEGAFEDVTSALDHFRFREGMRRIMALSSFGNQYFDEKAPWKMLKEDREGCKNVIYNSAQIVAALSTLTAPYLPYTSRRIREMMCMSDQCTWAYTEVREREISRPEVLFRKIEEEVFSLNGIEIRVGRIREVEDHPRADKLYVLRIDLGDEERQIIAGLRGYLGREELIDKKVLVVTNLKYVRLRGMESQGMLLAAEKEDMVVIVHSGSDKAPGTRVGTGYYGVRERVEISDLRGTDLRVEGGCILSSSGPLRTEDGDPVTAEIEDGAVVR